jgi:SAM-dependent methyltransferase
MPFPAGRVPSNIAASRFMDFDLIASECARHRKIMLPVLDGLRDFVAGIAREAAVLELGSGTGNYIIALAKSTGCSAWGTDCAKGMLAQAASRGSEVQFAVGDATKLALAADRFDLVYSLDVIHYIGPTGRLVSYYQEARRVLKEDGRVCTVTHSGSLALDHGAEPLFPRGRRATGCGLAAYRWASLRYGGRRICRYRGRDRRPPGEGDQCHGLCGESLFRAEFDVRQGVRAGSAPPRGGSRHRPDPRHPAGADAVGHEAVRRRGSARKNSGRRPTSQGSHHAR